MKKIILSLTILLSNLAYPCADPGYDEYSYYYSLFIQETINDPKYFPFLLDGYSRFYDSKIQKLSDKNENIEEWAKYLNLKYEDAYYLVFKAKKIDIDNLIKGQNIKNDTLSFVNKDFTKKNIQSLKYISYSKYLEPYMSVSRTNNDYWWSDTKLSSVEDLDYEKVTDVLIKSWKAEKDKQLKLRYGYQLVRLAHYKRNFDESVKYFNIYVKSLNYKDNVMYYYALDQKAGAEKGLGNLVQANHDFFTVFNNTRNIKSNVYTSMSLLSKNNDNDYGPYSISNNFLSDLLNNSKTNNERNDVYLLLGYQDFNNPLSSINKILKSSPDAIQAKVLMARAINQLESMYLSMNCYVECSTLKDKRLPIISSNESSDFFKQAINISLKQSNKNDLKDKDFWNITTSFLYFLNKNYIKSKEYITKVKGESEIYSIQKQRLEMLIEVCEQPVINKNIESKLFSIHRDIFNKHNIKNNEELNYKTGTSNFIINILANRFFLQEEYAKSFLLQNSILSLEDNPDLTLIDEIEKFLNKKNLSSLEKYIIENISPFYYDSRDSYKRKKYPTFDVKEYLNYLRGNVYLSKENFQKALYYFNQVRDTYRLDRYYYGYSSSDLNNNKNSYNGYSNISNYIFGYNKIESFSSTENQSMGIDYMEDFKFIKPKMNKQELASTLIKLDEIAKKKNQLSAKANYLIGNFFYNTSSTGYYRHILRSDINNENGPKFYSNNSNVNIYDGINFMYYSVNYKDNLSSPFKYFDKASNLAKDDELKARIYFALSKVEQENHYLKNNLLTNYWWNNDNILIKNRNFFKELKEYNKTNFYEEVKNNCLYFSYYINNY